MQLGGNQAIRQTVAAPEAVARGVSDAVSKGCSFISMHWFIFSLQRNILGIFKEKNPPTKLMKFSKIGYGLYGLGEIG